MLQRGPFLYAFPVMMDQDFIKPWAKIYFSCYMLFLLGILATVFQE